MDRKRLRSKDQALPNQGNNHQITPQEKAEDIQGIKSIPTIDPYSANHQGILFQDDFWFCLRQSCWFYFNKGLFWGAIFGLTVILSAGCGVALTKIDGVEKRINQVIDRNSSTIRSVSKHDLTHPVNILLLEVAPNDDEIIQFSSAFVGKSKTILLLQFDPQLNKVKVINIPVDSRVKIPGFGWGTIGDANKYGGTPLISQLVVQLLDGITIDRYIRATPSTFRKLMASGKIELNHCNAKIEDCSDRVEQILQQQITADTIRQRLNIPSYLQSFETTLTETRSGLDTNLSVLEIMSVANFVKELEPDNIEVDLISDYTAQNINSQQYKQYKPHIPSIHLTPIKSQSVYKIDSLESDRLFKNRPIAVQNTTDSPELGMRFVDYLRGKNFQDVYLVEHIPLKLDRTKIIIDQSQLARAKHLKNAIGVGKLEPKSYSKQKPLTIQIGEDAHNLPLSNSTH